MVCNDRERSTTDIDVEMFACPDDGKGFSLRLRISLFYISESSAGVGNSVTILAQNAGNANRTGVNVNVCLLLWVEVR